MIINNKFMIHTLDGKWSPSVVNDSWYLIWLRSDVGLDEHLGELMMMMTILIITINVVMPLSLFIVVVFIAIVVLYVVAKIIIK